MKFLSFAKFCCATTVMAASVAPLMADSNSEKGEAFLKGEGRDVGDPGVLLERLGHPREAQ